LLDTSANTPIAEYERRRRDRQEAASRLTRLYWIIANTRIGVFLVAAGSAYLTFWTQQISAFWFGLSSATFIALIFWHERVRQARMRAQVTVSFYDKALARMENRWAGTGEPGTRFIDESHPCAVDLDLFGSGSLFELLCTARTRKGQDTLADWLRAPAEAGIIRARQTAVEELRPRLDLREDLALLASEVPSGTNFEALIQWGAREPIAFPPAARASAAALAAVTAAMLIAWIEFSVSVRFVLLMLVVEGAFAFWFNKRVRQVLAPVEKRASDLSLFHALLARFERERFDSQRLRELRSELDTAGLPASRQAAQLVRLVDWLTAQENFLFAPIAPLLLWNTQFAFAIEAWRTRSGPAIVRWLASIAELEALSAVSTYAYENPADPFPEIVEQGTCFQAEALCHPLIPRDRCVANDVRLGAERQLLIISGSNMSGKSTLLRTIGVNTVLALAGAPVRARCLRVSRVIVGATLRIQDSLQAGRSRFFAEITRVQQLLDLAKASCDRSTSSLPPRRGGPARGGTEKICTPSPPPQPSPNQGEGETAACGAPPLLFLLDEVLQGTNSHDRRIGAEAIVRTLLGRGAIGLMTTHDLALTQIADIFGSRAANVHFEDQFQDGQMSFDYRIHPGVVEHGNALALMRAIGIEV
jgi:hypothetical protein